MNRKRLFIIEFSLLLLSLIFLTPSISFAFSKLDQNNINIINKANNILLQNNKKSLQANDLDSIVKERKSIMLSLIKDNSLLFLSQAISKDKKSLLPLSIQSNIEDEITINAQIQIVIFDDFENKTEEYNYKLITNDNKYDYYPVGDINFKSGQNVSVKGYLLDNNFISLTSDIKIRSQQLAGYNILTDTTGNQRVLVLPIKDFSNTSVPFTKEEIKKIVFEGQFQKFMNEQSEGKISFSGDVFDWYSLNKSIFNGKKECVLPDNNFLKEIVDYYNIDLNYYDRVLYLYKDAEYFSGGCSDVGKTGHLIDGTIYNLSNSIVYLVSSYSQGQQPFPWTYLDSTISHEMGHALGLIHANGKSCINSILDGNCTDIEYGNHFDIMGSGYNSLHFSAISKEQLGWLSSDQIINVNKSGVYEISPQENGSKTRLIKILNNNVPQYFVEMRAPFGFDSNFNKADYISNTSGLFINKIMPGNYDKNLLLDMSPGTDSDWRTNSSNVTLNMSIPSNPIKSLSDSSTGITIGPLISVDKNTTNSTLSTIKFNVSIGSAQCARFIPEVELNPYPSDFLAGEGSGGTFHVKNMDYLGCNSSQFSIIPIELPEGWTYQTYPNEVFSINPGNIGSVVGIFMSPQFIYTGDYTVAVEIKNLNSGLSKIITTTYHVTGENPPIEVLPWIAPDKAKRNGAVPVTLNFKGGPTTDQRTIIVNFTDSNGILRFSNEINPKVSTMNWSGSTSVSDYIKIPGDLSSGKYKVTANLYSVGKTKQLASGYEIEIGEIEIINDNEKYISDYRNPNFINTISSINNSIPKKIEKSQSSPRSISILPWNGPANVPTNSLLAYNVSFKGGPTLKDERIFVHFIDKNGNIKFVSDIVPSIPTTQWSGNISFPVTVSVPNDISSGDYAVVAGLYSGNSRVPLNPAPGVSIVQSDINQYKIGSVAISNTFSNPALQSIENTASVINTLPIKRVDSKKGDSVNTNSSIISSSPSRGGGSSYSSSPAPTINATPTPTATPILIPIVTQTPTPSISSTPTATPVSIPTPSSTPTPISSPISIPISTPTASPISTPSASPTPTI